MSDDNVIRPPSLVRDEAEACANCRFFLANGPTGGYCRRKSPLAFLVGQTTYANGQVQGLIQSQHPPTGPEGWCGEYEARSVQKGEGSVPLGRHETILNDPHVTDHLNQVGRPAFDPGKYFRQPVVPAGPETAAVDPGRGDEDR